MSKLKWEEIKHDHDFYLIRSKVIGGWLVIAEFDALSQVPDGYGGIENQVGHQFRPTMTFVPDPNHEWKLDQ